MNIPNRRQIKQISGTTYANVLDQIIEMVRNRSVDLDVRHIVIVPDKYTLMVEQRLHQGTAGAMDVEVLTLDRLLARMRTDIKPLTRSGAIMLVRRIVSQLTLTAMSRSLAFDGFCRRIYDTLGLLKSCLVDPQQFARGSAGWASSRKLADIAAIFEQYELQKGQAVDPSDRLRLLAESILAQPRSMQNTYVYVANFEFVTRAMGQVFDALASTCAQVVRGDVIFQPGALGDVSVLTACNPVEELKNIAKRIKYAVGVQGLAYRDIALVYCGDSAQLMRIFDEFDIPLNIDHKYRLDTHPLCRMLVTLTELNERGFREQEILALAKNFYAGIARDALADFVGYVECYAVDYAGFWRPFELEGFPKAEQVRQTLLGLFAEFLPVISARNAPSFATAMREFLQKIDYRERTDQLGSISGQDFAQVCTRIDAIIDEMSSILGNIADPALLMRCFVDGLSTDISRLPVHCDAVTAGNAAIFRGHRPRMTIISGFNDGVLPTTLGDSGIITDFEIAELVNRGVQLRPTVMERNHRSRIELLQLVHSSQDLVLSYIDTPSQRPSYVIREIVEHANSLSYSSHAAEMALLSPANTIQPELPKLQKQLISLHFCCLPAAEELILTSLSNNRRLASAAHSLLATPPRALAQSSERLQLDDQTRQHLLGRSTSASRLETFFACPYKYFAQFGLGLTQRQQARMDGSDIGVLMHEILEHFVNCGRDLNQLGQICDQVLGKRVKYTLVKNIDLVNRLRAEAERVCRAVAFQAQHSRFEVVATELNFGTGQHPALDLDGLAMTGKIDYVDHYQGNVRLIDYKSGSKVGFAPADYYCGVKMQLILYLRAMQNIQHQSGQYYSPCAAFYFPVRAARRQDMSQFRLSGVFVDQLDLIAALDDHMCQPDPPAPADYVAESQILPLRAKYNAKGKFVCDSRYAISRDQLDAIIEYVHRLACQGVNCIRSGYIAKSPALRGGSACTYCNYITLCRGGGGEVVERHISGRMGSSRLAKIALEAIE